MNNKVIVPESPYITSQRSSSQEPTVFLTPQAAPLLDDKGTTMTFVDYERVQSIDISSLMRLVSDDRPVDKLNLIEFQKFISNNKNSIDFNEIKIETVRYIHFRVKNT